MARKKKVSPGNRLVAYYRYSGGSQQTEQSIEGQRRDCEAYARQHGLTIVHEYIDRHISGRGVESRLAFQQMIADSSKHLFDLVICWKTDRFARNRYDSAVYKKKLRDNGVRILYAAESSVEGPEGIILEGLMESLAEYYSAELAQKMRRGMRESALKGKAINPNRPQMNTSVLLLTRKMPPLSGSSLSIMRPERAALPSWISCTLLGSVPVRAILSTNAAFLASSRMKPIMVSISAKPTMSVLMGQSPPSSTMIYGRGRRKCSRSINSTVHHIVPMLITCSLASFSAVAATV